MLHDRCGQNNRKLDYNKHGNLQLISYKEQVTAIVINYLAYSSNCNYN